MISSKELMDATGISRATLNNYIQQGLLPRPAVGGQTESAAALSKAVGYFPEAALARIEEIRELKRQGLRMADIAQQLSSTPLADATGSAAAVQAPVRPRLDTVQMANLGRSTPVADAARPGLSMPLSLDNLEHPAYMLNYNMELVWYNEPARTRLFGFSVLPSQSRERCLFNLLSRPDARLNLQDQRALASMNLQFALRKVSRSSLEKLLETSAPDLVDVLTGLEPVEQKNQQPIAESTLQQTPNGQPTVFYRTYAVYFREGILLVLSPETDRRDDLLDFLKRRDKVIDTLLQRHLPVLTPLAVLVADLQNSVRICSELAPHEYFELINQIWNTMGPILRKYGGTHGKHAGDGIVYYFFPQPESNYLFNTIACAMELKEAMRQISSDWQYRKRWFTELQLNIGLHEGQEWLGTFQSANHIEFVVLGDTINQASRLSDFARQGSIWATKSLVSRLTPDERSRIEFGINRASQEYGDRFVPASYAQIDSLIPVSQDKYEKLRDIAQLSVTEIRRVATTRSF